MSNYNALLVLCLFPTCQGVSNPPREENFSCNEYPYPSRDLNPGEVLLKTCYLSVDAALVRIYVHTSYILHTATMHCYLSYYFYYTIPDNIQCQKYGTNFEPVLSATVRSSMWSDHQVF